MEPSPELAALLRSLRLPDAARRKEQSLTGAAVAGDLDRMRAFLDAGADVEERSIGFASPLQAAAGAGRLAAVELLLERGADPRAKPEAVFSPLSASAGHGHVQIVRRLLAALPDLSGESRAVGQAAAHGRLECLELLLETGVPVGEHAGHTLRVAAFGGHLACVRRLLAAGIDPRTHPDYARDLFGEPVEEPYLPRQAALDNGHTAVALLLDGKPVGPAVEREHEAQRQEEPGLAGLARVLGGGRRKENEPPALAPEAHAAALHRALEAVQAARRGAWSVRDGGSPWLALAAETAEPALVSALIEAGAPADDAGEGGRTALFVGAELGRADLVELLLGAGADPGRAAADRRTPLMAAAQSGEPECVRRLLDAGADPRVRVRGRSAVGYAAGPHKAAIRALIEERARAARGAS